PGDMVDLDKQLSMDSMVIAYAYCEIEAKEDAVAVLTASTNDDGRAWFNGQEVISDLGPHGHTFDGNLAPVFVKKGRNTLLLKVLERGGLWQFSARLIPITDPLVAQRMSLFHVVTSDDGVAHLRALPTVPAADQAVASAQLKAVRA